MAKRFHVNLANPSFGVIGKGRGIVTILGDGVPPVDPPEPQPENNFIWECIFDNPSGANIQSVAHACEEGFEYMALHIDYEGDNEAVWSHAALFPGDRASGTWSGQAMDTGILFGSSRISVDTAQHTSRILRVIRRPLPMAADEDSRVNGNEFVKVSTSLYHQWDLDYEYFITCYSGTTYYTATIVTDKTAYNNMSGIDKNHAFIADVNSNEGRWMGFEHDKNNRNDKSKRKLRTNNCSVKSVWRRPYSAASGTPSEFSNEWKRVKSFYYSAPWEITFNWQDNKEYLVMLEDRRGDWEIATTKILTFPGILNTPGVDRHKAGIAASAGGYSWAEFLQTSIGGTKTAKARWDSKFLTILERDLYLDGVSCLGEAPPASGPTSLNWMSDTPAITRYGTETFNQSTSTAEMYIGTNRSNNIPDTYADKYGETIDGIVVPLKYNESGRSVTPANAYHADSIEKTDFGWYLSVIDETVHTSGIKYVRVKGVSANSYAKSGFTLQIIPTNNQGDGYRIDHNLKVTDLYNDTTASLQDVYDMTVNGLYLKATDTDGANTDTIDEEFTLQLEIEFNDGTKFPHTVVLSAHSGGY